MNLIQIGNSGYKDDFLIGFSSTFSRPHHKKLRNNLLGFPRSLFRNP